MPLSTTQLKYLALAWQCFETEPKIDYEKFKTLANLASANSARELMRVTKKKLREEYGGMGGERGNGESTPKTSTTTPRKRATPGTGKGRKSTSANKKNGATTSSASVDGDGDVGSDDGETPVKKKARKNSASPAKGKGKVKVEEMFGDEYEMDVEGEDEEELFH